MAKKSVFSRPYAKESHDRNAFDRSYVNNFNLSAGMLIPTFCQFVFGHSHVRLNQRSFMRSATVLRPAFPSLPMYTDYFFVPMHQILSNWNAFRSRTNDRSSVLLGIPTRLPSFSKADLDNLYQNLSTNMVKDDANLPAELGMMRLIDMLGYGNLNSTASDMNATGDLTPLKLCVYQKAYYDHYRNTSYERNNVEAYNIDDLYGSISTDGTCAPTSISMTKLRYMSTLHYVNYKRDFFNTIYPSLNFVASSANGLQSLNSIPSSVVNVALANNPPTLTPVNNNFGPFNGTAVDVGSNIATSNGYASSPISTNTIRAAFALEKLLRVSAFAPQHVVDQFEARFGYKPKSASLQESVRLGSFKNDILLGEVTSTADTGLSTLGEVGGKGVGAADYEKVISYDVPEDGFIIAISYVLPTPTYDSTRVDMINQQFVPEDWSLPEYENLGLQPIFGKNLHLMRSSSDTDAAQIARGNGIPGYQPRDIQYKVSVSENHGLFIQNGLLSPFVLHGRQDVLNSLGLYGVTGFSYKFFKCIPQDLNNIFAQDADGTELRDQFYGCVTNSFACIQDKPIFGIPKL